MKENNFLFTSESVSEGHPDKLADKISDTILDTILQNDPKARVACETFCANETVVLGGEITTNFIPDYEKIVRDTIKEVGYNDSKNGIDFNTVEFINKLNRQSLDIKIGVDKAFDDPYDIGAGDQGLVFGYATNETIDLMPYPIHLAHKLVKRQAELRKDTLKDILRPDAKSQVTIRYENNKPVEIDTIVLSTQHCENVEIEKLREIVLSEIIKPLLPEDLINKNTKYFINPTGRFVTGGPKGDCGLTGRKIIVDTYGGAAPHGGGAFSGKDTTKVDRSAAYYARYVAKNIVGNNLADRCQIQVSYAIGVAKPVSIYINTFGTEKIDLAKIYQLVQDKFDFRPKSIIDQLDLFRPIYSQTSTYGHFGRSDINLPWEEIIEI